MSSRHGLPLRGLMDTSRSPLFQGRFGRIFRSLPHATFGRTDPENETNLKALAAAMSAGFDPPKDGFDEEESGIPALYTYLGQFIDHDLTFDPDSSLQKQNDPGALTDYRNPAFDLDNIYGRGPDDQPYMYDGFKFLTGDKINGGDALATDLPRNQANPRRALIGDPRNDENTIVSQLQGIFHRFHNRIVADNPGRSFEEIQRLVRFHYQYVVLNDFLPQVIHSTVLSELKSGGAFDKRKLEFYRPKNEAFMPVEFSAAAYRLGHSMIRPGYRLNDSILLPIFPVPSQGFPEGLTGFRAMNPAWGIDFGRFIDIDVRKYDGGAPEQQKRLQFAYRLDTSLVNAVSNLPSSVAPDPPPALASRNLLRGWRLGLPSGQNVARAMGKTPIPDDQIFIGKATDTVDPDRKKIRDILPGSTAFHNNCPLWTYILAEATQNQELVKIPVVEDKSITTPRLGPVGGRIVAEVFLGLMFLDKNSMLSLDPCWQPANPNFKLKDFVKYALGK
jgi:Animal haem peroxidase